MFLILFLLFTLVPIVELTLLIWLSKETSLLFTMGLVLFTGFLGAALARIQGFQTMWKLRGQVSKAQVPTDSLIDAAMILLAGGVLLAPGILTDLFGFSLLIPPIRDIYRTKLKKYFKSKFEVKMQSFQGGNGFSMFGTSAQNPQQPANDPNVIDVEYTKRTVDEDSSKKTIE